MDDEFDFEGEGGSGRLWIGRGRKAIVGGFVCIFGATILNFLLDAMSQEDIQNLPWLLPEAFESGGKLGVSIALCCAGVLLIVWGAVTAPAAPATSKRNEKRREPEKDPLPVFGADQGVVLTSAKYLNKKTGKPDFHKGTTNDPNE